MNSRFILDEKSLKFACMEKESASNRLWTQSEKNIRSTQHTKWGFIFFLNRTYLFLQIPKFDFVLLYIWRMSYEHKGNDVWSTT